MSHAHPDRYTTTAIVFHWLLALAIIGTFCFGLYMTGLQLSPHKLKLYNYHKWAGITILALSAARLLWRLSHRPPADVAMPAWQRAASHTIHWALYALFFAVPIAGWMYSSSAGFPVVVYGVLPLPDLAAPDKALAEVLKVVHKGLAYTLAACVLLHVAGALKHQFVDRNGLLARMRLGRA